MCEAGLCKNSSHWGERRVDYDWRISTAVTACAAGVDRGGYLIDDCWAFWTLVVRAWKQFERWQGTNEVRLTRGWCALFASIRTFHLLSQWYMLLSVINYVVNTLRRSVWIPHITAYHRREYRRSCCDGPNWAPVRGGYFALYVTVLRGCSTRKSWLKINIH